MSDVALTRFNVGSDVPMVNLSLSEEDIRSTSLRVVFSTPLDGDAEAGETLTPPDMIIITVRVSKQR